MIENPLSEAILHGEFAPGDTAVIDTENNDIIIKPLVKEALGR
jgi:hypothetical protein